MIYPFKHTAAGALLNCDFVSYAIPSGRLESLSVLLCCQVAAVISYDKSLLTICLRNTSPPSSDALLFVICKGKSLYYCPVNERGKQLGF